MQRNRTARLHVEPLEDRTLMSTCHVTRLSDTGVGKGFRGDLRYCINKVNAESGPDVIDFTVTGTINLTGALPELIDDVAINGPGANQLIVRRDTGGDYRILAIASNADVEIYGITVTNGASSDYGGGIYNQGTLLLDHVVVSYNTTTNIGGGIYSSGTLTAYYTDISNNSVTGDFSAGGGIVAGNASSLHYCTINNNLAQDLGELGTAFGGGIAGSLTITYSTISGNRVESAPGRGKGGGISGGGLIENSTIANNSAYNGGGIEFSQVTLTLRNSTVSDNHAQGLGGGIHVYQNGSLHATHSTIARNTANNGGGIQSGQGSLTLAHTIIAGNSASIGPDQKGPCTSSGYNVFGNLAGIGCSAPTDILGLDPLLGPLADNGGPTLTHALLPGSPAIDAGDNTDAPEWDQRGPGFPRIVNGTIDIGAFEVQSTGAPSLPELLAVLITGDFEKDDGSGG